MPCLHGTKHRMIEEGNELNHMVISMIESSAEMGNGKEN